MTEKIEISFEERVERLTNISKIIDSDKISLEESLELFEESISHYRECMKVIEKVENRIDIVLKENGDYRKDDFRE